MLITADWLLTAAGEPISDGGVLVDGDRVAATGSRAEIARAHPRAPHRHFAGCTITPGLINCHTHLSLTALQGLFEPDLFESWLARLVVALRSWTHEEHAASAAHGARLCLASGVTVVGDIAYGSESAEAAATVGLGGTFFWEVLGISAGELDGQLEAIGFFDDCSSGVAGTRIDCGLSPHSTYTSGAGLLQEVHRRAHGLNVPTAIHIAESPAETRLLLHGDGPLALTAQRVAQGFAAPGKSAVAYLDELGVLENTLAIHLGELAGDEVDVLAAAPVCGAVACPRSNRFLHNRVAPVSRLRDAGISVGIGTDSAASNLDLDLMAEVRLLRELEPDLTPGHLFDLVTRSGARALGCEDRFGSLEAGKQADLALFRTGVSADPIGAVIDTAGSATLTALMSAGTWRILEGEPVDAKAAQADARSATAAAEKAAAALKSH